MINKRQTEKHFSAGDVTEVKRQINFKLIMYEEVFLPDFTDTVMNNLNGKSAKVCKEKSIERKN